MKKLPKMPKKDKKNNKKYQWITFIIVVVIFVFLMMSVNPNSLKESGIIKEIGIGQFQEDFKNNKFKKVSIGDYKVTGELREDEKDEKDRKITKKIALMPSRDSTSDWGFNKLDKIDTEVAAEDNGAMNFLKQVILTILPIGIIIIIMIFLMRQFNKGASGAFSFGRSKDKLFNANDSKKTTFEDVAGCKEAKQELEEIVDFLKNPKKFIDIGASIPKGVMLFGAPGTGKTLLSRAVAGEAGVPFSSISGSEFVEMFVGVGASRVRDLFEKAKKNAPSIIFIDEIDAVGRQRGGAGFGGGHDEREQTLNQILSEMDGFEESTNVIVMAATNRPEVLDKALLRPGRFDRRVVIDKPDVKDREAILNVHAKNKKMAKSANLEKIAKMTPGFAGADLANMLNEAAIVAAKSNKKTISQKHLEYAVEKVMIGPERRSLVLSEEQKKGTAYHEAGHAIVSHILPHANPVRKVTIIPRGMALGLTWSLPKEDNQYTQNKSQFLDEICVLLGGYVAEKLIFEETATGVSNDLQRASLIAKNMVTRYGMSDLGPIVFGEHEDNNFMGMFHTKRDFSEEIAKKIDLEISKIIKDCLIITEEVLVKYQETLEKIAKTLLKKETLDAKEFDNFFE